MNEITPSPQMQLYQEKTRQIDSLDSRILSLVTRRNYTPLLRDRAPIQEEINDLKFQRETLINERKSLLPEAFANESFSY